MVLEPGIKYCFFDFKKKNLVVLGGVTPQNRLFSVLSQGGLGIINLQLNRTSCANKALWLGQAAKPPKMDPRRPPKKKFLILAVNCF
jgi:hypothetical protein